MVPRIPLISDIKIGSKDQGKWVVTPDAAGIGPNTFHILRPNVQHCSYKVPSQLGSHPIPFYLNNN